MVIVMLRFTLFTFAVAKSSKSSVFAYSHHAWRSPPMNININELITIPTMTLLRVQYQPWDQKEHAH